MDDDDSILKAHRRSLYNEREVKASNMCGCFCCLQIYPVTELDEDNFIEELNGKKTVVCPYCAVDAILGDKSGYPITHEFLVSMKKY